MVAGGAQRDGALAQPLTPWLKSRGMSLVASRRARPTEDPIFSLNSEANARKAKGEAVLNATLGAIMDDAGKLMVLPSAMRALREIDAVTTASYAPIVGTADFLEAVKDDMLRSVPELRARAVAAATPGGSGALHHAVVNFLEPGQAMLTTNFFWAPYHTLTHESGRTLETFNQFDEHGGFDVAALDAAVAKLLAAQGRVLLVLNDPCHNPTGYSMHLEEWRAVVACLTKHAQAGGDISLLLDVAYIEYAAAADPRVFVKELLPLADHALIAFAWSASKSFTMYGLRVGALVVVVPEAERAFTQAALTYSCRGTWSNCNHGGLAAITRLLIDPELRDSLIAERDGLKRMMVTRVERFNEYAKKTGLVYPRYEGGFFVTVFHPNAMEQAARMRDCGVFVVPGPGSLRVALCSVAEVDIPRLVDALALS